MFLIRMCGAPHLNLKYLISSYVSLAQLWHSQQSLFPRLLIDIFSLKTLPDLCLSVYQYILLNQSLPVSVERGGGGGGLIGPFKNKDNIDFDILVYNLHPDENIQSTS